MALPTPGNRVVHGARAKVIVDNKVVGIFNNISFSLTYDAQPVYILGQFEPEEINYTAQEVVNVTASGWRVVDTGPHVAAKLPYLSELINQKDITLAVLDRQTGKKIGTIKNCKPTGFSTNITARQQEEITVNFAGIYLEDESVNKSADSNANTDAVFPIQS